MPLVEQELLTLPDHVISPPFLVGFVLLVLQFYVYCSMFGIRDEISSGIGRTMKPERSDGSDLRWKRSETKADEPRGERWF